MSPTRDLPISLDLLRGFEAAARRLSFTTAASELFLTQSAVSRQVQQLEEQLGVRLFERRTRALVLTEAGELYYREVARALNVLREATTAVRARTTPVVRVTTTVTFASLWLVPRLAAFQREHEDISVHLVADNAVRDLDRMALDVAIRYCPAAMATADAERLFGETVVPVASPRFLKSHPVRSVDELMRSPLLELDDPAGVGVWLSWRVWCEAMGIAPPRRTGLTFSQYDQIVQAAVAGQGVALGRVPLVEALLEDRRLAIALPGRNLKRQVERAYWLIVSQAARARDEVRVFTDWLRRETAGATPRPRARARVSA
jgi:DNA-binding transcriptional LysR family regulator